MAVDVELCHGRQHRIDFVLFAGQRRDQLPVVQAGRRRGQSDLHQRHRVGSELQEGGVSVVHRVADALSEIDAVAQSFTPVVHVVDGLARADVTALVNRGEIADLQRERRDALEFGGELAQQGSIWVVWLAPLVWNLRANLPPVRSAR